MPLLIQKLARFAVVSWLEKAIVEYILQALVEGAQDPPLGQPDRCVHVEFQTFLQRRERESE